MRSLFLIGIVLSVALLNASRLGAVGSAPRVSAQTVFAEQDGELAIEAEDYFAQAQDEVRGWQIITATERQSSEPDDDPAHVKGASGGGYIEALPDTRRTHDDPLVNGENFSNSPGKIAVLRYKTHFTQPGRYYVWARTYATGSEDNGIHFGLDGEWPESGQRWQTVKRNAWTWECKQRTEQVHTGVPMQLYLDVPTAGEHELLVSMREDGFELDKMVLTLKRHNSQPQGAGPAARTRETATVAE